MSSSDPSLPPQLPRGDASSATGTVNEEATRPAAQGHAHASGLAQPRSQQIASGREPAATEAAVRLELAIYLVVAALSAAGGLVVEIVAGRMIAPYLGMSLYTWTAIIAVVLAGFTAGHWVGGWLAEKPAPAARRGVALALLLAGISTALSLVLLKALSAPLIALGLQPVPTILLLTGALFFLPSFFVGIPSPVLTKLAIVAQPARMGTLLGAFYAIGALGSIFGTLAAGYFFISYLGSVRTILTVAVAYVAMAAAIYALDRRRTDGGSASIASGLLPLLLTGAGFGGALLLGHSAGAFTNPCKTESAYYCIRVVDVSGEAGTPARTMVLDHLGHGTNVRDHPNVLVSPYVEAQDTLVGARVGALPSFEAFFIGGGAYTLPRAWLNIANAERIVVAEIDPAVTLSARHDFWLPENPRLEVLHKDARRALLEQPLKRFAVIVGDAFHDIAVPQHLVTREFFELVRTRLAEDGLYVMNVVDSATRPRLLLSIERTLADVFDVVEIWKPSAQGERQTYVILASAKPTRGGRLRSARDPNSAWRRLSDAEIDKLKGPAQPLLLTDDFAPVDRLIGVD